MNFPIEYYYFEKTSATHYTQTPTGVLDVNQMLQSKPYWIAPSTAVHKPKKIVLADWRARNWSQEKAEAIFTKLTQLIVEGFRLYVLQHQYVVPLTREDLTFYGFAELFARNIPLERIETIIQIMINNQRISREQVHVLDDYGIDALLAHPDCKPERTLLLSDINHAISEQPSESTLSILRSSHPPISKIIVDYNYDTIDFTEAMVQVTEIEKIKIEKKLQSITLYDVKGIDLEVDNTEIPQIKKIKIKKRCEYEDEVARDSKKISTSLTPFSSLEHFQYPAFPASGILSELNSIKHICMTFSNLTSEMKNFPHAKRIEGTLNQSIFDEKAIFISNEVESINLFLLQTTSRELLSHLKTPHLKFLKLVCKKQDTIDFKKTSFDAAGIEVIHLTSINPIGISTFISKTPNIKKLSICSALIAYCGEPQENSLKHLKELDLKGSSIDANDIGIFLSAAPNIQNLDLRCQSVFEAKPIPATPSMIALNQLHLNSASAGFITLLNTAPNIRILTFEDRIDPQLSTLPTLHSVSELTLDNNNLNSIEFIKLLSKLPHLKKLILYNCQNLQDLTLPANSLSHINRIIVDNYLGLEATKQLKLAANNATIENISYDINERTTYEETKYSAPITQAPSQIEIVDADTTPKPNTSYNVQRIFYPEDEKTEIPDVSTYRLRAFNKVTISDKPCDIKQAFSLSNDGDLELEPWDTRKTPPQGKVYRGYQHFIINTEWQPIASLSPYEVMEKYVVNTQKPIEVKYSQRDNSYYIRAINSTHPIDVHFQFSIKVPNKTIAKPAKSILPIIESINHFTEGEIKIDLNPHTGHEYLRAIALQKKGACRHRSIVFKEAIKSISNTPARIINNQCHSFVEIKQDDEWLSIDLGGYQAKLNITDNKPVDAHNLLLEHKSIEQPKLNEYDALFQTWNRSKEIKAEPTTLNQDFLCGDAKKRLIEFNNSQSLQGMRYQLEHQAKITSRPFFYVDTPDDLICASPYIQKLADNTGVIRSGPGGKLYDFIQANKVTDKHPVILINYDHFQSDDIVRLNSILDKKPTIDNIALPNNTLIIGLINTKKENCYQGSDFYSRFDEIKSCSIDVASPTLSIHEKKGETPPKTPVVNLFHANDWKERLLGHWVLHQNKLHFQAGVLDDILKSPIFEIQNAPWSDEKFVRFLQGRCLNLDKPPVIFQSEGYEWNRLNHYFNLVTKPVSEIKATPHALNLHCLNDFFSHYTYEKNSIQLASGLIENAKGTHLSIYLTRTLGDDDWAKLLTECCLYNTTLDVCLAPGVSLPKTLQLPQQDIKVEAIKPKPLFKPNALESTQIISSTDMDVTVSLITQDQKNLYQVIDISECNPNDLLPWFDGKLDEKSLSFTFKDMPGALISGLNSGRNIILKGQFSTELIDKLAPMLLKRTTQHQNTRLIIITDTPEAFSFMPQTYFHQATASEINACLNVTDYKDMKEIKESFSQLKARQIYSSIYPQSNSYDTWKGMHELSVNYQKLGQLNPNTSIEEARAFTQSRLDSVNTMLSVMPYVYLAGLSGVGKSTFVIKELKKQPGQLFCGEENMLAWAENKNPGRKILFIDEANLKGRNWSEFEGLFQSPPGILIKGVFYPLTAEHKVIFAGNPVNYSNERTLPSLFRRHGGALVFEPLPLASLYEDILKPVFNSTPLQNRAAEISAHFLEIYRFLVKCSTTDILISPRELQMMALLTVSYCTLHPNANQIKVAHHFAFQIACDLPPPYYREAFVKQFYYQNLIPVQQPHVINELLITPSRLPLFQQLNDLLALHEWRQNNPKLNEEQQFGGLGGLIIEGSPGIGKSEIVIQNLIANGYIQRHYNFDEKSIQTNKIFYSMPVNLSTSEKTNLLLKAFNEGAGVIIDEINSSPMMEDLLNDLLMGRNPNGSRPAKPGFMIISTQNPVTMAGRRAASTALARRLTTVELTNYDETEMCQILRQKGMPELKIIPMVKAFLRQYQYAVTQNLSPCPTFRDVLREIDQHITPKVVADLKDEKQPRLHSFSIFSQQHLPVKIVNPIPHRSPNDTPKQ